MKAYYIARLCITRTKLSFFFAKQWGQKRKKEKKKEEKKKEKEEGKRGNDSGPPRLFGKLAKRDLYTTIPRLFLYIISYLH